MTVNKFLSHLVESESDGEIVHNGLYKNKIIKMLPFTFYGSCFQQVAFNSSQISECETIVGWIKYLI